MPQRKRWKRMKLEDSKLRIKCVELHPEAFDKCIEFGREMIECLKTLEDGVALAANQIGSTLRLFVSGDGSIYINPEILSPKTKRLKFKPQSFQKPIDFKEGCLSLPFVHVEVPRWEKVRVKYINENKEEVTRKYEGFEAIMFQHEVDHLDGILITDYEGSK